VLYRPHGRLWPLELSGTSLTGALIGLTAAA
jgi:hypothetical protein